jgi:hypothetical protein
MVEVKRECPMSPTVCGKSRKRLPVATRMGKYLTYIRKDRL